MEFGRSAFSYRLCTAGAVLIIALLCAAPALAGPKCGGSGGTRTQTFTCGSGEFINRVFAEGASYAHRVQFGCARVSGGGGTVSQTLGGKKPGFGYNSGTGTCLHGQVVWSLEARCGWYLDRITELRCGSASSDRVARSDVRQTINVGGMGGSRTSLQCPKGQGIYKVRVKSGDWIDSIEVFCRKP